MCRAKKGQLCQGYGGKRWKSFRRRKLHADRRRKLNADAKHTVDVSEILHHLGCLKRKSWDIYHINCRISSINSRSMSNTWTTKWLILASWHVTFMTVKWARKKISSKRTRASPIQPGYIFLEQDIIPLDSPLKRYDCTSQKGIKHIEHIIWRNPSVYWVYMVLGLLKDIQTYHRQIRPIL